MKKIVYILIVLASFNVIISAQEKTQTKSIPLAKYKIPYVIPLEMAEYFVGEWVGQGEFSNGKKIEAEVSFTMELDNQMLLYRHTDRLPNKYKALGIWGYDHTNKFVMIVQDNFGGSRIFESDGWQNGKIIFLKDVAVTPTTYPERFTFEAEADNLFKMTYEASRDGETWKLGDYINFRRKLISVKFAGPPLMSYPIQVSAAEIKILPGPSGLSQNPSNSLSNAAPQTSNSDMTKLRRAIDAGNVVWAAAWAKGDAAMLPETFTTNGKELVAGGKVYKGRKQILALMRDSMQKRGGKAKLTVTTTDAWLDGNTAYETGTAVYEFTVAGQSQTLERRYFTVWKRQSKRGVWKIYSNTGIAKE
ncbi:MAG: SgcJ/EcaC family oxidoreductase [Acidobacteriota bacterium]|nr:SgcJ/EcaC family oxidoreductase [Acidobacteriota bacterium]